MGDGRRLPVLVDVLACKPGQSGILSHGVGIVRGMARAPGLDVTVLTGAPALFDAPGLRIEEAPVSTRSFIRRAAWRERFLPRIVARTGPVAVVSSVPELPFRRLGIPALMVVHDVGAAVAPALYGRLTRLRYELLLRGACGRAAHLICVSDATLLDLHRWAGVDPLRCSVIPNAAQDLGGIRTKRREAADPYVLVVGNVFGNKNTVTILRAMARLRDLCEARGSRTPTLVMAGPLGGRAARRLAAAVREAGVGDLVEHRGYLSASALGDLYGAASALVFPSLYDGLGSPVLVAAAAGIRVSASDLPPIREIASPSARLVDRPLDPQAWATAIIEQMDAPVAGRPGSTSAASDAVDDVGRAYADVLRRVLSA